MYGANRLEQATLSVGTQKPVSAVVTPDHGWRQIGSIIEIIRTEIGAAVGAAVPYPAEDKDATEGEDGWGTWAVSGAQASLRWFVSGGENIGFAGINFALHALNHVVAKIGAHDAFQRADECVVGATAEAAVLIVRRNRLGASGRIEPVGHVVVAQLECLDDNRLLAEFGHWSSLSLSEARCRNEIERPGASTAMRR